MSDAASQRACPGSRRKPAHKLLWGLRGICAGCGKDLLLTPERKLIPTHEAASA